MASADEALISRLDTVIRLLAAPLIQGKTTAEAVRVLDTLGIDANQIAVICGVAPNVVRARISEAKRRPKKRLPRSKKNNAAVKEKSK